MAAAGPHLCIKSWGALFQVAGVLGRSVLLPPPSSSESGVSGRGGGSDEKAARRGFAGWILPSEEGEEERELKTENQLWAVLEALWEFAFLQVSCILAWDVLEWRCGVQKMYDHGRCLTAKSPSITMEAMMVTRRARREKASTTLRRIRFALVRTSGAYRSIRGTRVHNRCHKLYRP